jgi:hypothetical protein
LVKPSANDCRLPDIGTVHIIQTAFTVPPQP